MESTKIIYFIFFFSLIACQNNSENKKNQQKAENNPKTESIVDSLAPVMLDDIHYYTTDRAKMKAFFEEFFEAKQMAQEGKNPFTFIDFMQIHPEQSTINISAQGPFPGMKVSDVKRWQRKLIPPSSTNPSMYGVHWVAFGVEDLDKTLAEFEKRGIEIVSKSVQLPFEKNKKTASIWGTDYNLIVLVEDKEITKAHFSIHHLQLLVTDVEKNAQFFEDVFKGKILKKEKKSILMEVGKHLFVLSEPEDLGLERTKVVKRNAKEFRPNIDHLGFQYINIEKAYQEAIQKGYTFILKPFRMRYYDKETAYSLAITFSPDSLQCEMYQEDGRIGPRIKFLNPQNKQ